MLTANIEKVRSLQFVLALGINSEVCNCPHGSEQEYVQIKLYISWCVRSYSIQTGTVSAGGPSQPGLEESLISVSLCCVSRTIRAQQKPSPYLSVRLHSDDLSSLSKHILSIITMCSMCLYR
jgi:hypothetical protein